MSGERRLQGGQKAKHFVILPCKRPCGQHIDHDLFTKRNSRRFETRSGGLIQAAEMICLYQKKTFFLRVES